MVALARMGIGKFTIADPDVFEIRNSNRQYGAMRSTNGQAKAEVMRNIVHDINPEAEIRAFCEPIGKENAATFLEGRCFGGRHRRVRNRFASPALS